MSYTHLTTKHRYAIELLSKEGYSCQEIAQRIGFNRTTVYRELLRGRSSDGLYCAQTAQRKYEERQKSKGRPSKSTPELLERLTSLLKKTWSPEQIVGRIPSIGLSFKTIYTWIYEEKLGVSLNVLRHKGKSRKPAETRGQFRVGRTIAERPLHVQKRCEFGHWELDTMVSSRGKSKGCFATFVEMKTRYYIAVPIADRSKESMFTAIQKVVKSFPAHSFLSMTSDRGKEFACYKEVEALGIPFYFADPYAPWQRGSNENSNGLLREFFPKKTDLASVSAQSLLQALHLLNHRPRKCLQYKTPVEALLHELQLLH